MQYTPSQGRGAAHAHVQLKVEAHVAHLLAGRGLQGSAVPARGGDMSTKRSNHCRDKGHFIKDCFKKKEADRRAQS